METIGKISATERNPTTCNDISFWLKPGVMISPFDIVKVQHMGRAGGTSNSYAIITSLSHSTDSPAHLSNFVSSDFGDVDVMPLNRRLGITVAEANVLYNDDDVELPIEDGQPVEWADEEGIREALGLTHMEQPIPAGYMSCSGSGIDVRVDVDGHFLLGPEGAHLNISGMSGLATKTSYAMFLLQSIQQTTDDTAIVLFNVKGSDLLHIDKTNENLTDYDEKKWKTCGLNPCPFKNVTYYLPYGDNPNSYTQSKMDSNHLSECVQQKSAFNYIVDPTNGLQSLSMLFHDIEDPNATFDSIIAELQNNQNGTFSSWDDIYSYINQKTSKGSGSSEAGIHIASWRRFRRLVTTRTSNSIFTNKLQSYSEKRRQLPIDEIINHIQPNTVTVIDIEPLPDYLQAVVVGTILKKIYDAKTCNTEDYAEDETPAKLAGVKKVVIFADELNKYAPQQGGNTKTLTRVLLDVAERGRSLGVVLFGAEQFRSGVHERVIGNCGTHVFGRTSSVELNKCADYKHMPDAYRNSLLRLTKGTLLLQHAVFKTGVIRIHFPKPAYYQPKN